MSERKHFQLGVDPDALGDADPEHLPDDADLDAVWADATTVEQYAEDLRILQETCSEDEIAALRAAREQT